MSNRSRFERSFDEIRSFVFNSRQNDPKGDRPPISDDVYDRIPDRFKSPGNQNQDHNDDPLRRENNNGGRKQPGFPSEPPRRSPMSTVIFIVALAAAIMLGYQAFFSPKTTEITWTAFNKLLDAGQIESCVLKGTKLTGELRGIPQLEYWPEVLPNGKAQFEALIAQYDRAHAQDGKEYNRAILEGMRGFSRARVDSLDAKSKEDLPDAESTNEQTTDELTTAEQAADETTDAEKVAPQDEASKLSVDLADQSLDSLIEEIANECVEGAQRNAALSGLDRTWEQRSNNDNAVLVAGMNDGARVWQFRWNGSVFKSVEVPAYASFGDNVAAVKGLLESYALSLKIQQRWKLALVGTNKFGLKGALQLIDAKTDKPVNKFFFEKYECEAPSFAYADQELDARLRKYLDSYSSSEPSDSSNWVMLLSVAVSILFLVFLFKMIRNANEQFGGGFGGFGGIARSLAKRYDPDPGKRVTFDDVAGMDAVKAELVEIVDYLKNPRKYERMGARVPKGTLLFGPPGTGKTLLARAVAGEAGVPFFSINGSEFIQMFVGVGASRVRDLFATAKENAPSILFIDEIDAVGRQRGAGVGGGQDEREQTLNQILSEMDGFSQNDSVMVMASTNRPDVLDPALMRPGRFDRHITVGRPSMKGRVDIFKVYLKKIPYASDVDVDKLSKTTSGFTGADIRNLVNEATLWATRNNKNRVEASDFDFAFEKISLGLKRDEIISPENKRKTARHEAGHAIVGWFIPNGTKVHKITIIPRGRALGVTWSLPDDDQLNYNESEARATLAHLLAGRAAEKLIYDETSSGVENDLQRATELARNMVARWGMSERIGAVAYPDTETHPFLGKEMSTGTRTYSEDAAKLIDDEIKRTIDEADESARRLLIEKRDLFDKLTEALVEEEELDETRIVEILGPCPHDKKQDDENDVQSDDANAPVTDEAKVKSDDDSAAAPSSSDVEVAIDFWKGWKANDDPNDASNK